MSEPPPRLARPIRWFLRQAGDPDVLASIEEDLAAGFRHRLARSGRIRAFLWRTGQILLLLTTCVGEAMVWRMNMIHNYIRSAGRHLLRRKLYSFINIAGLALGLTCFILIGLWIRDEMTFDQFHVKRDRIFRVLNQMPDGRQYKDITCALGPALREEYSEVEEVSRLVTWASSMVRYKDRQLDERGIYLADPGFFRIFSFPFVRGNPETALADKYSVVLTEPAARRIFGDEDALGKVIHCDRMEGDFRVTGVIGRYPATSHLRFDILARIDFLGEDRLARWSEWTGPTYILLKPGVIRSDFEARIADIYQRHLGPEVSFRPVLQPLREVYLYEDGQASRVWQVALFSGIAIFILLMACINYMNLSTAQFTKRAREVGIRKVVGARRGQIIRQYLGEALLIAGLALGLSVILALAALPVFNLFCGKQLSLWGDVTFGTLFVLGMVFVGTGLLAGSYPAFFLSSFRPVVILRERITGRRTEAGFRRLLIVVQFAIAIGLIVCTRVVSDQLDYISTRDLGLDRENIVVINNNVALKSNYEAFKSRLLLEPDIRHVTTSATLPLSVGQSIPIDWEGNDAEAVSMDYTVVDYDFFEAFDMDILQGRSFSRKFPSDEASACILSESAVRRMGLTDPIGRTVYLSHPAWEDSLRTTTVVGVVNDFHARSLHTPIRPFVFRMYRPYYEYVLIKIDGHQTRRALDRMEAVYHEIIPGHPFQSYFLEDTFQQQYVAERRTGKLFNTFAWIAVLIACLGMYGLSAFIVEQRTKEIGIRKTLGASTSRIVALVSRDFLRWVALANLLAWPVAWLVMDRWLQDFAYKVTPGIPAFVTALGMTLLIAILALAYHVTRAARADPVDALRYE